MTETEATSAVTVTPDGILLAIGDAYAEADAPKLVRLCTPVAGGYVHAWERNGRDTYQITDDGFAMSWARGSAEHQAREFAEEYGATLCESRAEFDRACETLNEAAAKAEGAGTVSLYD